MYGYVAGHLGPAVEPSAGGRSCGPTASSRRRSWARWRSSSAALACEIGWHPPAIARSSLCLPSSPGRLAYRGVQVSAIVMLVLEAISVSDHLFARCDRLARARRRRLDPDQLRVKGGFPRRHRPRAIAIGRLQLRRVRERDGVRGRSEAAAGDDSPRRHRQRHFRDGILRDCDVCGDRRLAPCAQAARQAAVPAPDPSSRVYGLGYLAVPITVGAVFSAFSVCLACITTGGTDRLCDGSGGSSCHASSRASSRKHDTPNVAVTVVTATALAVALVALALRRRTDRRLQQLRHAQLVRLHSRLHVGRDRGDGRNANGSARCEPAISSSLASRSFCWFFRRFGSSGGSGCRRSIGSSTISWRSSSPAGDRVPVQEGQRLITTRCCV